MCLVRYLHLSHVFHLLVDFFLIRVLRVPGWPKTLYIARTILNVGPPISLLSAGIMGKCLVLLLVDLSFLLLPALYMFDTQSTFKVPFK